MGENMQQLDCITHQTLIKIAEKFIVHGLYNECSSKSLPIPERSNALLDNSGLEIIIDLWNTSDNQLRMYGSAEELTDELKVFRSFTSSDILFDVSKCEIYITPSTKYPGSSDPRSRFCYKQEFTSYFGCMPFLREHGKRFDLLRAFASFLMRHESRVTKLVEMIRCDDPVVLRFVGSFSTFPEIPQAINPEETFDPDCDLIGFLKQWKVLVPFMSHEEDFAPIREELIELFSAPDYMSNRKALQLIYTQVMYIFRKSMEIIVRESMVLQPYEVSRKPKRLRAFIDEQGDWLLMVNEVELMLKKKIAVQRKSKHVLTISKKSLIEEQPDLKDIEYVEHLLVRTKHRFVPVLDPFARHCILAIDSFYETMRDLFFGVQLFQKIEMESWYMVEKVFAELQPIYDMEIKNVYFINYEEHRMITQNILKSFPDIDKTPAKSVRNAKKDGFTLQNLKNELVHLGLNKIFTEIEDYAQASYERVCTTKKEAVLRTCDLFEAIEHCQLASLCMRFNFLGEFCHIQQACYRSPSFSCIECNKGKPQPSYAGSEWREITEEDVEITRTRIINGWSEVEGTLKCRDGTVLLNTLMLYSSIWPNIELKHTMSMIDSTTAQYVQHYVRGQMALSKEPISNLFIDSTVLYTRFRTAKLYLRAVPTRAINSSQHRRVFVQDLSDILSALRLRYLLTKEAEQLLEHYNEKWQSGKHQKTIGLDELKRTLEALNIDKQLITLVPDNTYVWCRRMESAINAPVRATSPSGQAVVEAHHVVSYFYKPCAGLIDWNHPESQKKSVKKFREKVILQMRQYADMDEGLFVDFFEVLKTLEDLQADFEKLGLKECIKTPFATNHIAYYGVDLFVILQSYKQFGFDYDFESDYSPEQLRDVTCQHWQMKTLFALKWLDRFFDESTSDLREIALQGLLFLIPMIQEGVDPLKALFPLDPNVIEHFYDNILNAAVMEGLPRDQRAMLHRKFTTKEQVEETIQNNRIIRKVLLIDDGVQCVKCKKTLERCEELEKKLACTRETLVASKKEDERLRNEMQMSFGTRICKLEENTKSSLEEIISLKREMRKKNEEMKVKNDKFLKNETSLKEKVTKLESELKSKNNEMTQLTKKSKQEKGELNSEVEGLKHMVEKLQQEASSQNKIIQKLTFIRDEKDKYIDSLMERLSTSNHAAPMAPAIKQHLLQLQSIRNALLAENPARMVGELIRNFTKKATDDNMKSGARKELLNFNVHFEQYQKALEHKMVQSNGLTELTELDGLPEFPTFSDEFMVVFERTVKPEVFKECYICIEDMLPREEKTQCQSCRTNYHTPCLKKWLETAWICPICKKDLVVK